MNDTEITGSSDLVSLVGSAAVGDGLTLTVYRQGTTVELSLTVGEQIQSARANEQTTQQSVSRGMGGFPSGFFG